MLSIANNNIERLVRLVNDILALNRLESGQVDLKYQWCSAASLVQQAFASVETLATTHQIRLEASVPDDLQVWADPDWLVQVLVNLVNNAIKFSPPQTAIAVTAEAIASESIIQFSVADQGRGIPADKLQTIFGRFQQVDASDSRHKGGTGLGLAICRQIVQQHGGRIWAESELNKGSTFYFTLPHPQQRQEEKTKETTEKLL
jgi:signal transduction histidine kinase